MLTARFPAFVAALALAFLVAGCGVSAPGEIGKPVVGRDLSGFLDRLTALDNQFTGTDPSTLSSAEAGRQLRRFSTRYRALAEKVGAVDVSDRSEEEQVVWLALYELAGQRAAQFADVLRQPDYDWAAALNQIEGTLEQVKVDKLNWALGRVRRP